MKTERKKEAFLEAYQASMGNVSMSCQKVKIARSTYYDWCDKDDKFKDEVDALDEAQIDFAETMLKKNIKDGKEASTFFYLKCKAKHRGYIEQSNIDLTSKGEKLNRIEIEIITNKGD